MQVKRSCIKRYVPAYNYIPIYLMYISLYTTYYVQEIIKRSRASLKALTSTPSTTLLFPFTFLFIRFLECFNGQFIQIFSYNQEQGNSFRLFF